MDNLPNKTLPYLGRERNEETGEHRRRVVVVEVIVEPVVVPVPLTVVPVQVQDVPVTVRAA